ncbi:MAG: serine/threonine-protein kinase RsbW [Desulforhopalus sp.]|jgi:serine/threonine-protein kinase RsbW
MIHLFQILKDREGLTTLAEQLESISRKWQIPKKDTLQLNLILDELISNIIDHGGGCAKCPIEVRMEKTENKFKVQLSDGGPPFDPTQCKPADVTLPMDNRRCGGLGILFIRKFSDCCSYERLDGKNIFNFTKTYEGSADTSSAKWR